MATSKQKLELTRACPDVRQHSNLIGACPDVRQHSNVIGIGKTPVDTLYKKWYYHE